MDRDDASCVLLCRMDVFWKKEEEMSNKLIPEKELQQEKNMRSPSKYIKMLEYNNEILRDKLKKAIGFLELQEKHLPDGLGFMWREIVIGDEIIRKAKEEKNGKTD